MSHEQQPINAVRWLKRTQLKPNHYNPNHVAKPELELLITSILEDGWTQPIVVLPEDDKGMHVIVDGFHRWTVSADPRLQELPVRLLEGQEPIRRCPETRQHY